MIFDDPAAGSGNSHGEGSFVANESVFHRVSVLISGECLLMQGKNLVRIENRI